ncbi:MAG: GNAT family N-acetyltransferase [Planctomycetes bacterium]|nr:GNAT family N-acetyltransferase [Planctomycetota bacterium]
MTTASDSVTVRNLRPRDLDQVILLDSKITGRERTEYFKVKLAQAMSDTGVQVSLAAEVDGQFVGFLLARVYYGEFGTAEQTAVLDTIGVNPNKRGAGVGSALLRQLRQNLIGLGLRDLRTEVSWDDLELLAFFHKSGFRPAPRIGLDLDLVAARRLDELRGEHDDDV